MLGQYIDFGYPVSDHPLNRDLHRWYLTLPGQAVGGSPETLTRNAQLATMSGGVTNQPFPTLQGFQGWNFDGSSGSIALGTTFHTGATQGNTYSAWVRMSGSEPGSSVYALSGLFGEGIQYNTKSHVWLAETNATSITTTFNLPWTDGGIAHLLYVLNSPGFTVRTFLNGVFQTQSSSTTTSANDGGWWIGSSAGTSSFFPGKVWNVQLWGRPISDSEAWQVYQEGITGFPNQLRRWSRRTWLMSKPILSGNASGAGSVSTSVTKVGSGSATAAAHITATKALIASSVESAAAHIIATKTLVASSVKSGAAHVTATKSLVASSVKAGAAHITATESNVASSVEAGAAHITATEALIASSVKAGAAHVTATETLRASSVKAAQAAISTVTTQIASFVKSITEFITGSQSHRVLTNLITVSENITALSSQLGSGHADGEGTVSAVALEQVLTNFKAVDEYIAALSVEVGSGSEASDAGSGATAVVVGSGRSSGTSEVSTSVSLIASSLKSGTGRAGASAVVRGSGSTQGAGAIGVTVQVVGNQQSISVSGGVGVSVQVVAGPPVSTGGPGTSWRKKKPPRYEVMKPDLVKNKREAEIVAALIMEGWI